MTKRVNKLQIGDRVAFARTFLRNTGQMQGWAPFARGTVLSKVPFAGGELCRIQWDAAKPTRTGMRVEGNAITGVLDCNLVRADRIHLEPV